VKIVQFYCLLAVYTYMGLSRSGADLSIVASDKLLHFAGYVVFIISAMVAFRIRLGFMVLLLFTYSVLIEIIQYFLPYRTFEGMDIIANLTGLIVGSVLWVGGKRIMLRMTAIPESDSAADE